MFDSPSNLLPRRATPIDWSNPIVRYRQLRFFVTQVGGGAFYEHVLGKLLTRGNSAVPAPFQCRGKPSMAAKLTAASFDYLDLPHHPNYNIFDPITLIWQGQINSASAYRQFVDKNQSGNDTPFEFRTENGASLVLCFARQTGSLTVANSTLTVPLNTPTQCAVSNIATGGGGASTALFAINGAFESVNWTSITAPTNTTTSVRIGRRQDGAVQMNGFTEFVAGFAGALTRSELRSMYDNPAQVFLQSDSELWLNAMVSAGGAPKFLPEMLYPQAMSGLGSGMGAA